MSDSLLIGDGVAYARLASIKGRLKLESKGLRFRGPSTRGIIADEFGLTPRTTYAKFIEVIQAKMDGMLAARAAAALAT